MKKNKIDYLQYSWFINGLGVKGLEGIKYKETSNLIFLDYTKEILKKKIKMV